MNSNKPETSHRLIALCILIGMLTMIGAPIITFKLAQWKIKQDQDYSTALAAARAKAQQVRQSSRM